MNPIQSSGSTDSREMISMAEEELARLQRQLRIMEEDRVAFAEETNGKLEKQRKIMSVLMNEKENLMADITVATCKNQKIRDKKLTKKIYKLFGEYEKCCGLVKTEIEQLKEINVQIKKLESDIKQKRPKSVVTESEYQNRVTSGKKSVETLKNRLDNVTKRFCAILTENKNLRTEIDHLLKERSHYNIVWDKMLRDINFGKKYMVDLIEQATLAFDQREEWCSKLEALKKRAHNDFIAHTEGMRELQRTLDHFASLREFLCVKGQKRILKDLEEKERKRKEFDEENLENQLQVYTSILDKIKEHYENEEDINKVAANFLKQEEENFTLFNYVNEINQEIEVLNQTVGELVEKIDEQIIQSKERSKEQQLTLTVLQNELQCSENKVHQDEESMKQIENIITQTLSKIESIFDLLKCERGPILYLLGKNTNITLFNVMIYLGAIERNVTDLITQLYFAEKSMSEQKRTNNKKTHNI